MPPHSPSLHPFITTHTRMLNVCIHATKHIRSR
jgi:hypothetical protein